VDLLRQTLEEVGVGGWVGGWVVGVDGRHSALPCPLAMVDPFTHIHAYPLQPPKSVTRPIVEAITRIPLRRPELARAFNVYALWEQREKLEVQKEKLEVQKEKLEVQKEKAEVQKEKAEVEKELRLENMQQRMKAKEMLDTLKEKETEVLRLRGTLSLRSAIGEYAVQREGRVHSTLARGCSGERDGCMDSS
jgi:hypothetical protein